MPGRSATDRTRSAAGWPDGSATPRSRARGAGARGAAAAAWPRGTARTSVYLKHRPQATGIPISTRSRSRMGSWRSPGRAKDHEHLGFGQGVAARLARIVEDGDRVALVQPGVLGGRHLALAFVGDQGRVESPRLVDGRSPEAVADEVALP